MGFFKTVLHSLSGIWDDVKTIKKSLTPNIVKKAELYDQIVENLDALKCSLFVSKIYSKTSDTGDTDVYVEFSTNPNIIEIKDGKEDDYDDFMVALNKLDLISVEDMVKIKDFVERNKK